MLKILEGYKTYITAFVGIIVVLMGYLFGPAYAACTGWGGMAFTVRAWADYHDGASLRAMSPANS